MWMNWNQWLREVWADLDAGKKIEVPQYLPHPASVGFEVEDVAEPNGQSRDWTVSLNDGSRLHVHEFDNGEMCFHRDRWDPDHGVGHLIKHMLLETAGGQIALASLAMFLFIKAVKSA